MKYWCQSPFSPLLPLLPMIIAVNCRFLLDQQLEGCGNFTQEVLQRWAKQYPEHQFHYFFDRPFDPRFLFSSNVTGHVLLPPARHPLLWKNCLTWR